MARIKTNVDADLEDVVAALNTVLDQASDGQTATLDRVAQLQSRRADRLQKASERLASRLPEDDPRLVALRTAAAASQELNRNLALTAKRDVRVPKINRDEWMVFGRVLDSGGRPLAKLQVRVSDRDRKLDELLRATNTDSAGAFALKYQDALFKKIGDKVSDLFLMVFDPAGKALHTSGDPLRFGAGQADYFEVVLDEETKPGPEKPTQPTQPERRPRTSGPAPRSDEGSSRRRR